LGACKKSELNQLNPNLPTPAASLAVEGGIAAFGAGILQRVIYPVPNEGNSNLMALAMTNHSIMGDEEFLPYGNFSFRWINQVYQVTLPSGKVVQNPFGVTQQVSLQGFNSRQAADRNAFLFEWTLGYFFISQANTMLNALNSPALKLSGNAASRMATYKAWAYWWKGYSYSRIGSMYIAGVITNDPGLGNTSSNFVDHNAIIAEANKNFDSCAAQLSTIAAGDADYTAVITSLVLSFNDNKDLMTPAMWLHQLNTYKARNLLVNKKTTQMTAADWGNIITWCTSGLASSDFYFKFGMTADGNNDLTNGFLHPLTLAGPNNQWTFVSERLVQDFKAGDARFTNNIEQLPVSPATDPYYQGSAFANIRSRGLQFGTRWAAIPIENGGSWATGTNQGFVPIGCSYEENALMLAEAYINTGAIDQGLQYVDQVRSFQSAGLAAVSGTGLTLAQAQEELRKERRIGLYLKGDAFYDARRWGVTAPAAAGGGRANAIVYVPGNLVSPLPNAPDVALPCFMEYNYMDYWDVPQNELDFNTPATGSAAVKS
jgi:hypothetical protein